MADDKQKRGTPDRRKVAGGEAYEVQYVATKLGVTPEQVKAAITKVGNDRTKVEAELRKK
jgi:hypothetical protein